MTKKCEHCEAEFDAKRADARYCSPACRQAAKREKEGEEEGIKEPDNKIVKKEKKVESEGEAGKIAHDAPTRFLGDLRKKKLGF